MVEQPFFYPAIIIGLASIPLVLALIPMNRIYGVRAHKTLSDDRIWYTANRFAGLLLLGSSVLYIVFSARWPMSGVSDPRFDLWLAHLSIFALPLLASIFCTARYLRKL